jgi:rhamnose transport system permease protein
MSHTSTKPPVSGSRRRETGSPATPSRLSGGRRAAMNVVRARETSILLVLLAVIAAATIKTPSFLFDSDSWRDLLLTPSLLLLLAVGQAVVIITRNVDLSVSSILGLTAYLTGRLFVDNPGIPLVVVILAGVAVGAALGAVNGVLAVVGYYMHAHRGGRELYAVGSDPDAAVLYGLPVRRRVIGAFVLSGAVAGLAGVLYAARYGTVSSSAGTGIELQAVAAVVIGGVAIFGGSGTVWGAAIGAFLLVTINRALPILGIPDFWQRAVVGALILTAIVLDRVMSARRARKLLAEREQS